MQPVSLEYNGHKFVDMHFMQVLTRPGEEAKPSFRFPYTHDPELQFTNGLEPTTFYYSDRLRQWHPDRYALASHEAFNSECHDFRGWPSNTIEKFLRLYFSDEGLTLTQVIHDVNRASGFPVWVFAVIRTTKD